MPLVFCVCMIVSSRYNLKINSMQILTKIFRLIIVVFIIVTGLISIITDIGLNDDKSNRAHSSMIIIIASLGPFVI
jgi:hypothetical protein